MALLPSFIEILLIGVGFTFLPIGEALATGELESRLFEACEDPYSYELAAWVLREGANPNAVSLAGETPLEQALRQRYETSSRNRYDGNTVMLVLLLKSCARLPDFTSPEKSPIRWAADRLDQITWDLLSLKFDEAELVRLAGWPLEPVAAIDMGERKIALPPPAGFVPARQGGVEKALILASEAVLTPEVAIFFVPEEQVDFPLEKVTAVAAFISRRDLLGLTGEDDALRKALSLSDDIDGRFFRQYFNNASYVAASPTTPVPWLPEGAETPEDTFQVIVSSHGTFGRQEPYQVLYYRVFPSEEEVTYDVMGHAHGLLAGWHFSLRAANSRGTE